MANVYPKLCSTSNWIKVGKFCPRQAQQKLKWKITATNFRSIHIALQILIFTLRIHKISDWLCFSEQISTRARALATTFGYICNFNGIMTWPYYVMDTFNGKEFPSSGDLCLSICVCTFVPSGFAGAHKPKNHFSYGLIDLARYQSQRFACDFVSTAATSAFYSSGLKTFSFYRACVPGETTVNSIWFLNEFNSFWWVLNGMRWMKKVTI